MSFEIVTNGLRELIARLDKPLAPVITPGLQDAAEQARRLISHYPPSPPHSHRTGALGRSWAIQQATTNAVVSSSVAYAPFIAAASYQSAATGRIGWKTDEQVAQELEQSPALTGRIAHDIADALSS